MNGHHLGMYRRCRTGAHRHVQEVGAGGECIEDTPLTVHDLVVDLSDAGMDDDTTRYLKEEVRIYVLCVNICVLKPSMYVLHCLWQAE